MANEHAANFDLTGSVVFITGPARGLGRASALACAAAGADLVLGYRDKAKDSGLTAEIERMGRKVLPLQLDVLKLEQIKDGVQRALDVFGRIDVLLNNVGVGPENPAVKVTEADFDYTVDANLKGTFFMTDRKSTRLNSSHLKLSRMPSSA